METTDPVGNNQKTGKSNSKDAKSTDIKLKILAAMRSLVTDLRDKADSFTFVSVRRLLEEDMGLDKYALDVHKSFVKEHLVKCLIDAGNDGDSENSQETESQDDDSPIKEATSDDEKAKDSPEIGLLNTSKTVAEDMKDKGKKEAVMSDIRKALRKRASYIKAISEKITMALLRRLLEQDLKLEKHSLDSYLFKKVINKELDEVLQIPDSPKRSTEPVGKNLKKNVESTPSTKLESEENSDSDAEDDEDDEEVAVKKATTQKRNLSKTEITGKRKCENGKLVSSKKKPKHTEIDSESDSDAGDSDMIEDNGHSQSSSEKPLKRTKETAIQSEESENGEDNEEEVEEGNDKAEEGSQSEEESNNKDDGAEESE